MTRARFTRVHLGLIRFPSDVLEGACDVGRRKTGEDKRCSEEALHFSFESLEPLFHLPIKQAAARLNICATSLKVPFRTPHQLSLCLCRSAGLFSG